MHQVEAVTVTVTSESSSTDKKNQPMVERHSSYYRFGLTPNRLTQGSAFNKPQTTALFQRDRALATQNRSVAVQRNDTAREGAVLQLISSSNLEVGRRTQALGEVRCDMKMARDLRLREPQPPCGKECT